MWKGALFINYMVDISNPYVKICQTLKFYIQVGFTGFMQIRWPFWINYQVSVFSNIAIYSY